MIYADNAASTPISPSVAETVTKYMNQVCANPSSLHTAGKIAAQALFEARNTIADCLGCTPREIYFTSGGSEADNQALRSAAAAGKAAGKRHIISTAFEHHAVLNTLKGLSEQGFEVRLLDVSENGLITPRQVENALREDTCLVTVMYANNEVGTILPVAEIAALCRRQGVIFHTDAVQAAGHLPLHVRNNSIDMLSLSAHKFHGPKGAGVLYARKGVPLESLILGGPQERGKRAGTENIPAIMGMAQALKEACLDMTQTAEKEKALRDRIIQGLSRIPHSILNGDAHNRLSGNVSFCFEGVEGESLLLLLDKQGICASSGSACTSGSLEPSHVLLALGRNREIARGSLRLTLSKYNTPQEAECIVKTVTRLVEYLRSRSPLWLDKLSGNKPFILP